MSRPRWSRRFGVSASVNIGLQRGSTAQAPGQIRKSGAAGREGSVVLVGVAGGRARQPTRRLREGYSGRGEPVGAGDSWPVVVTGGSRHRGVLLEGLCFWLDDVGDDVEDRKRTGCWECCRAPQVVKVEIGGRTDAARNRKP